MRYDSTWNVEGSKYVPQRVMNRQVARGTGLVCQAHQTKPCGILQRVSSFHRADSDRVGMQVLTLHIILAPVLEPEKKRFKTRHTTGTCSPFSNHSLEGIEAL